MDSKNLLDKILQRFKKQGKAQASGYNAFLYQSETSDGVNVLREKGTVAKVTFVKILVGIEAYKENPQLYNQGPTALREFGITHITSPVYAMLHLLGMDEYQQ
jgi:hypothetical protein